MIKILVLSVLLINVNVLAFEKSYCSLKYFGLSLHPHGAVNEKLIPLKLDHNGVLVPNVGIVVSIERLWNRIFGIKIAQAFYFDCALQPAGFSHVGFRGFFINNEQHQFNGGIGPTLIIRRTWEQLSGYIPYTFYKNAGNLDYKVILYGGEFEYDYKISQKHWFSIAFIPGYPDLLNLNFGLRW